jgi:hypothetical protein
MHERSRDPLASEVTANEASNTKVDGCLLIVLFVFAIIYGALKVPLSLSSLSASFWCAGEARQYIERSGSRKQHHRNITKPLQNSLVLFEFSLYRLSRNEISGAAARHISRALSSCISLSEGKREGKRGTFSWELNKKKGTKRLFEAFYIFWQERVVSVNGYLLVSCFQTLRRGEAKGSSLGRIHENQTLGYFWTGSSRVRNSPKLAFFIGVQNWPRGWLEWTPRENRNNQSKSSTAPVS